MRSLVKSAPARLGILAAAGLALAGLLAAQALAGPAAAHQRGVTAQSTFTDWPMFMGGPTHTGVSPETVIGTTNAAQLTAGWTADVGSTVAYASPVVATSSTGKAIVYDAAGNHVRAWAATSGALIWKYPMPAGDGNIDTTPAVFDGAVYFGSTEGDVFAVNARTGALICSLSLGQQIQASPVVVASPDGSGPILYDGTDPDTPAGGGEYAIWGAGNTHGQCTEDWEFTGFAVAGSRTWSSPAYATNANGTPVVVFGDADPDDSVYALNATTGQEVWDYQTSTEENFDVGAPPDISAPGTNGFADGVVYVIGKDHTSYAIDLTTGALIWQTALGASATNADVSGEALVGDTLYGTTGTGVYALDATTGAVIWNKLTGHAFYGSPAVTGPAGQQVLVVNSLGSKANGGKIYVLNLNGKTLDTIAPLAAGKEIWASPAISQGTIFVVGLDSTLRTYAPPAS
jgi:eukaryotic-like serine/threonine-protein kinase